MPPTPHRDSDIPFTIVLAPVAVSPEKEGPQHRRICSPHSVTTAVFSAKDRVPPKDQHSLLASKDQHPLLASKDSHPLLAPNDLHRLRDDSYLPAKPAPPKTHRRCQTDPAAQKLKFQQEEQSLLDGLTECLKVQLEKLGDAHPRVGLLYNQIGTYHFRRGDFDAAGEAYQEALTCYQLAFNVGHAETNGHSVKASLAIASTLCNVGAVHWKTGKLGSAVAYLEEALRLQEFVSTEWHELSDGSIEMAQTLHNLGIAQSLRGDYKKAKKALKRAQDMFEDTCGPFHVDVARAKDAMGRLYSLRGKKGKALKCHKEALRIKAAILNAQHPSLLSSMMNVANVHREIGELDEAELMYREVLSSQRKAMYKAIDLQYRRSITALVGKTIRLIKEVQREKGECAGAEPTGKEETLFRGSMDDWGI